MRLQGKISGLRTTASESTFRLLPTDTTRKDPTEVLSNRPLGADFKDGDEVVVTGTEQPDPPFPADTVTHVTTGKPSSHILLYVAVAVALLLIVGLVYFFTQSSGNVWTIKATDSGAAATNVPISLFDINMQPVKSINTGSDGAATFSDLASGTYYAGGPGAGRISGIFTKKTQVTSTLAVSSPYTWTVQTTLCNRGDANNQLNLVSSANVVLKTGVTDASGRFAFTNLATGTYKVLAPGNLTASATVNGTTAPPASTLAMPVPQGTICWVLRPFPAHALQLAPHP